MLQEIPDLAALSDEQRRQLAFEALKLQEAQTAAREAEEAAYKELASDTVLANFPYLREISRKLGEYKRSVRNSFAAVLELKAELYGTREGQQSHQFMSEDGRYRIRLGYNVVDNYDDTAEIGIAMVRGYIYSLAHDERSRLLVESVLRLLSKDTKGTLKASRVLQLQQMAEKSGDASFIEGVRIIRNAYRPVESKSYIRAEFRNDEGAWVALPLGITEAD